MKSFLRKLSLTLFIAATAAAFSSCDFINSIFYTSNPEKSTIIGSWESTASEKWVITDTTLQSYFGTTLSFAGDSVKNVPVSDTAGYIYIKYTTAPYGTIGNWYALHYKELTSTSCKISSAYKNGGVSDTETYKQAVAEFTVENGYYGLYSEAVKK